MLERIKRYVRMRRVTTAHRLSQQYIAQAKRLERRLSIDAAKLTAFARHIDEIDAAFDKKWGDLTTRLGQDLDVAKKLEKKHEVALDALRGENKVLSAEMEVLGQVIYKNLAREKEEASIHVLRQVASSRHSEE